ncbi:MAG: RluA family pseudouridine synthase, partial [Anaeroplasmataceae bacterium]
NKITVKDFIINNISLNFYQYIKRQEALFFCNQYNIRNHEYLNENDILKISYYELVVKDIVFDYELDIIYEDDYLLVINKSSNILTIPTIDNTKSIYNAICNYYHINNINKSIHFINRLDKDTSGLLLVAKDKYTSILLSKQLANINRRYLALVKGVVLEDNFVVNNPILKNENTSKREINKNGKSAITNVKVLSRFTNNTIVELELETGRTHQIRVHLSSINHPIINDKLYNDDPIIGDMFLHSYFLSFKHPITQNLMEYINEPSWYIKKRN